MGLITDCLCTEIVAVLITIFVGVITFFKWRYRYWEKRNVPYIKPTIPFGTMKNPFGLSEAFGELIKAQYEDSKRKGYKHVGLYTLTTPTYMPVDTEVIKDVLTKNFNHFVDRGFYCNEDVDPLSAHLFSLEGAKWRNLRVKLTPTFTSGKMKMMFHILVECGKQLTEAMNSTFINKEAVDIKDMLARFGTDIIGQCAFGINCNSFKDPNSDFRKFARRVFIQTKYESIKGFFIFSNPEFARYLGLSVTPPEVTTFFTDIIKTTVAHREKNNVVRKDFLQILIDLKDEVNSEKSLTIEEIAAQAFIFFIAGFETSSTTMTFCLYELSQNPEIQERVRDEINSILDSYNGEITYEAVKEMKYMKQVIDEVLRKYPPLPMLNRKCGLDYAVPNTDVTIEKGTTVIIPTYGLHYDPEYFPDPEKFDPERFNEENKKTIKPFTYLPFGEGPKVCIGLRFGLMQTGVGLTLLLKNYRFSLSEKTELPLKMNPASFSLSVLGDIWLNVERI